MQQNVTVDRAPPRTPLGELSFIKPIASFKKAAAAVRGEKERDMERRGKERKEGIGKGKGRQGQGRRGEGEGTGGQH